MTVLSKESGCTTIDLNGEESTSGKVCDDTAADSEEAVLSSCLLTTLRLLLSLTHEHGTYILNTKHTCILYVNTCTYLYMKTYAYMNTYFDTNTYATMYTGRNTYTYSEYL